MKKLLILFVSIALVMLCTPVCVGPVSAEVGDEVIHMFICYGQSWSVGYDATPVITTTPRYDNLMLDTGIRTADIGDMSAVAMSFVPAVESQVIEMVNGVQRRLGETPVSAQMNMVQQMMEAEKSIVIADLTYTMLGTDRLIYGDITTDAYKWVNHNRGHLRDSQGDYLQYKSGNPSDTHSVLPLHNWCVLFDKTIDELGSFCDEVLPGDVDGNGEVANRDLGLLQRHLNGWDVTLG